MGKLKQILLPGTDKQFLQLINSIEISGKNILVIGAGTEEIAKTFAGMDNTVIVIVEEQENLLQIKYMVSGYKDISVRLMDFDKTDFKNDRFDIIYAQASISSKKRNKIVKEIWRILKPAGIFCIGEVINLKKDIPQFVNDIWQHSGLSPLFNDDLNSFYAGKGFKFISETDLSYTLKDFYLNSASKLKQSSEKLTENEQSYYKKVLKQISHESNAYLKLGGEAFMGFRMLILEKIV